MDNESQDACVLDPVAMLLLTPHLFVRPSCAAFITYASFIFSTNHAVLPQMFPDIRSYCRRADLGVPAPTINLSTLFSKYNKIVLPVGKDATVERLSRVKREEIF